MHNDRVRNAVWNTVGNGFFAAYSFVLLIVVTRQYGVTSASTIGICLTASQLLFRVGIFATRQYQVTDTDEKYSFSEYGATKIITTVFSAFLFFVYYIANRICGALVAIISLLYWIPIILRDQKSIVIMFSSGFVVALIGTILGAATFGIRGIVIGYSIGVGVISILLTVFFEKDKGKSNGLTCTFFRIALINSLLGMG